MTASKWLVPAGAVIVGVGVAYVGANVLMTDKPKVSTPPPATPAPPAKPPKVEFLGAATPAGADPDAAQLGPDDAKVVWLRVTPRGAPAASGGGRGGGRGPQVVLTDSSGTTYTAQSRPAGNNLVAVHIKKGYSKDPGELQLAAKARDTDLGSWKVNGLPAPKVVLATSTPAATLGVVNLQQGRRGLQAVVTLKGGLKAGEGMVLKPVEATYTPIDASRMRTPLVVISGKPGRGNSPLANPAMQKEVAFDQTTFAPETLTETVTFKTARIENRFGQPTLVVDKDETVTGPAGFKVTLPAQKDGPVRQPRHIHPQISAHVAFDLSDAVAKDLPDIQPAASIEWVSPSPQSLGLAKIDLKPSIATTKGVSTFELPTPASLPGTAGTFKIGPIPALTVKITVLRPKVVSKGRIVLKVDPKPIPAPPRGEGGGGRPSAA